VADCEPHETEFPADRACPGRARRYAVEYAVACGADPHAVALCVSEAVTNAVIHAYRDTATPGVVRLCLRPLEPGLEICVADEGRGLAPRPDSPGMGLGMPLIAAMSQGMDIETSASGTRLLMRFGAAA
jgi:serine/threonine-protein kinase RsbW